MRKNTLAYLSNSVSEILKKTLLEMNPQDKQKVSKKRDFAAHSHDKNENTNQESIYSSINEQYRQLFLERQEHKNRMLQSPQKDLKTHETKAVKEKTSTEHNHKNFNFREQKSRFFINKLTQYPKEELTPNMLGFSDIFCKNPFYEYSKEQPRRDEVESIFMTTYGYETELLLPIIKSNKHFVLANDKAADDRSLPPIIRENDGFRNWTLIHPPKDSSYKWGGAFHPKLWLIKFKDFLRVVVGSGNLHVSDWSVWSNSLWYQDFPLKSHAMTSAQHSSEMTKNVSSTHPPPNWDFEGDFKSTLSEFVAKMMPSNLKYQELLRIDLNEYDYSAVRIILVSNTAGRFADVHKYGRGKLLHIVEQFKKYESEKHEEKGDKKVKTEKHQKKIVTYECTSLGNIDNSFLQEFYACATGEKSLKDLKRDKSKKEYDPNISEQFRVIFPTDKYINEETVFGPEYAAPIILNQKFYEKDSFPKQIFHQLCAPEHYFYHTGMIPHLKVMLVTNPDLEVTDDTLVYAGSHNFTAAAWGRFEKDFTQIYCSNTELGIVYPPQTGSAEIKKEIVDTLSFSLNAPKYSKAMKPFLRNFE